MFLVEIFGKTIFDKKVWKKNREKILKKNKNEKMLAKKKVKFGLGFTVHLKSLPFPPPQKRGGGVGQLTLDYGKLRSDHIYARK